MVYEMKEVLTDLEGGKFKRTQVSGGNVNNAEIIAQRGEVI